MKRDLGVGSKVLADVLASLVKIKAVERQLMMDRATYYKLTEKGKRLATLVRQISSLLDEQ